MRSDGHWRTRITGNVLAAFGQAVFVSGGEVSPTPVAQVKDVWRDRPKEVLGRIGAANFADGRSPITVALPSACWPRCGRRSGPKIVEAVLPVIGRLFRMSVHCSIAPGGGDRINRGFFLRLTCFAVSFRSNGLFNRRFLDEADKVSGEAKSRIAALYDPQSALSSLSESELTPAGPTS